MGAMLLIDVLYPEVRSLGCPIRYPKNRRKEMDPLEVLGECRLLDWSSIWLGYKRGWVRREDICEYAISQLGDENCSENIAILAGGGYLSDEEFEGIILNEINSHGEAGSLDKWRLAFLLCIAVSNDSYADKVSELQEIYAEFGYPEDMASCSVYSSDEVCPLEAMNEVVKNLRKKLLHQP